MLEALFIILIAFQILTRNKHGFLFLMLNVGAYGLGMVIVGMKFIALSNNHLWHISIWAGVIFFIVIGIAAQLPGNGNTFHNKKAAPACVFNTHIGAALATAGKEAMAFALV